MDGSENLFGENRLGLWDKIRLLHEWSPVLSYVQEFLATDDVHERSLVVSNFCEWLASKTPGTTVDDELVKHVDAILRTAEGEAMLRWVAAKVMPDDGGDTDVE